MKVDLISLLNFFDELLPPTNEEQGIYWFRSSREDRLFVTLSFSIYESYVDIIIHANPKIVAASLSLEKCSEIRVLDDQKKCLEILHAETKGRCFLSLMSESILSYSG